MFKTLTFLYSFFLDSFLCVYFISLDLEHNNGEALTQIYEEIYILGSVLTVICLIG